MTGSGPPRNPAPTVDILIEMGGNAAAVDDRRIVLIERKNPPAGWALPGGFVDYGESAAGAARREAREETSIEVELVELFHVYADPQRDRRLHTLSAVFRARPASPGAEARLRGADDAARAEVFALSALPDPLAFDHGLILADYRHYLETGARPPPDR